MKDAIGYLRVSTREQGRSGLGLAAQRHEIEAFASREEFSVKSGTKTSKLERERTRCSCGRGLRLR